MNRLEQRLLQYLKLEDIIKNPLVSKMSSGSIKDLFISYTTLLIKCWNSSLPQLNHLALEILKLESQLPDGYSEFLHNYGWEEAVRAIKILVSEGRVGTSIDIRL